MRSVAFVHAASGQAVLDQAVAAKLSATSVASLSRVLDSCRQAIDQGLAGAEAELAEQLVTAVLVERAGMIVDSYERAVEAGGSPSDALTGLRIQVRRDLEQALARDDGLGIAHLLRARIEALPGGDLAAARSAALRAATLVSDDTRLSAQAALLLGQLADNPREQAAYFDKGVNLMPSDPTLRRARGLHLLDRGEHRQARDDLQIAVAAFPGDSRCEEGLARACVLGGSAEQAIDVLDKAIARSASTRLLLLRAEAQRLLGRVEAAQEDILRATALEREPDDGASLMRLGDLFMMAGQPREAARRYSLAVEFDGLRWQALARRASAMTEMGDRRSAVADFEQAIVHLGDDPVIANNFAWLLATSPEPELRDGARAVRLADAACRRSDWQSWQMISTLAAAHAEQGDFAAAERLARQCIESTPASRVEVEPQLAMYLERRPWRVRDDSGEAAGDSSR